MVRRRKECYKQMLSECDCMFWVRSRRKPDDNCLLVDAPDATYMAGAKLLMLQRKADRSLRRTRLLRLSVSLRLPPDIVIVGYGRGRCERG